ncbi:hypothetical protein JXB27_03085 [Candidatus Woesearchaeota archaeon]|nr:hypothetical protein [Candidatus Woesearchaeota archaeon]
MVRRGRGRKGQITAFIIIGILILFSVSFVLYVATLRPDLNPFAPKESEIQVFVGTCLERISKDAIERIGILGGYYEVPENIAINERAYFSFGERTEPKIPLWYYRGTYRIPSKEGIADEISKYVINNIDSCINDFEPFSNQYSFKTNENKTAEVVINENDVSVKLNYDIQMTEKSTNQIQEFTSFARKLDVKLGKIYMMARDILESETRQLFFENATMGLLSTNFEGFPLTSMDFTCSPKIWRKSEIISFAKMMISSHIRKVTVEGNSVRMFGSDDKYSKNNLMFPLNRRYSDITAAFQYPETSRFELHVNPNDREILRSNVGKPQGNVLGIFLPFCVNTYHFTYDIEYPLLVTLRDDSAFKGDGFVFNFAFPVTINNNAGDKTDFPIEIFESQDYSFDAADFCADVDNKEIDIRAKNYYTGEDIYEADISYRCVRRLCDLGATDAVFGIYRLLTKLPVACNNGLLTATKEGYLDGVVQYDDSGYAEILMKPLRKFKVNITTMDSTDFNREEKLQKGDIVFVTITSDSEPDYEQTYFTGINSPYTEISLIDGDHTYNIDAMLLQDGERFIGGYTGTWSPTYPEMYGKSTLNLHLVKIIPLAFTSEQQANSAMFVYDDTTYQEPLRPTFS